MIPKKSIIMIIFVYLCTLTTCASLDPSLLKKKPKASIEKFDIAAISLKDIDLLFDVGITNPYPIKLNLAGISAGFFIEGKQVFQSSTKKGFSIAPKKKSINQIIVNLKYRDIEKVVRSYMKKDYLNCVVKGDIIVKLPRIPGLPPSYKFPFNLKKRIPAIKPSIKIKNFKVQKPSMADIKKSLKKLGKDLSSAKKLAGMFGSMLSGKSKPKDVLPKDLDVKIKVNFDIVLTNKTRAKMAFKKLDYSFAINGKGLLTGLTKDIKTQGNTSILRVASEFSSKALGKGVISAFKKKRAQFQIKGKTFIQLPKKIKKSPLKLEFDEGGEFSL